MEEDLHGPGIDARGAAFAGVNLYVELGHGRDYAWSATTATSDNVDTFAEVLCRDKFHYVYRGKCRPMEKLVRTESWTPNAIDPTDAGPQTLTAYRTVHGIVFARGKVHGRKVAFVHQRSTYFHEADSVIGFAQLNEPGFITGPPGSRRRSPTSTSSSTGATSTPNTSPTRCRGRCRSARRAPRPTSRSSAPASTTGRASSRRRQTADYLPFAKHPQAVDPPFLVSWNNKQAPGWAAADDQYDYGPLHRAQMIADKVRAGTKGKKQDDDLPAGPGDGGTGDRGPARLPAAADDLQGDRQAEVPALRKALATLRAWHEAGAHRRDLNRDGVDEETPAIELMDAWWPKLVAARVQAGPGEQGLRTAGGDDRDRRPHRRLADAPDFFDGWWGYVSKDLRDLFGPQPKAPYSRIYCGEGSKQRSAGRCCSAASPRR